MFWRTEFMMIQSKSRFLIAAPLCVALAACGGEADTGAEGAAANMPGANGSAGSSLTLADNGPDLCFKAAAEKLGADAKVSKLSASFGVGENLEQYVVVSTPPGELKSCSVTYQDPEDPRKLREMGMDVATGEFKESQPVEISVFGDAASFSLDDYLVPLSSINTSAINDAVVAQQDKLGAAYSEHALSRVTLDDPGPGRAKHIVSLSFAGRVKSNDVLDNSGLGLNLDGSEEYNNIGK
ncbi:hypothetical protein [Erythrobacter sp. YT30]|uniref:hypothetical protein n=1 Tax=Erythrobacter sp. YT30 TaxID=1735012 RepID=UPI001F44C10A|nr:hypothetical protein [Erythrobacter sp. YT30]